MTTKAATTTKGKSTSEWPPIDATRLSSNKSFNGYKLSSISSSSFVSSSYTCTPLPSCVTPILPAANSTASSGASASSIPSSSSSSSQSLHAYSMKLRVNHMVSLNGSLYYIDCHGVWRASSSPRCIQSFGGVETGDGLSIASAPSAPSPSSSSPTSSTPSNGCLVVSQRSGLLTIAIPSSSSSSLTDASPRVLYSGQPLGPSSPDFVVQSAVLLPDGSVHCIVYYFKEEFKVSRQRDTTNGERDRDPHSDSAITFIHGSQSLPPLSAGLITRGGGDSKDNGSVSVASTTSTTLMGASSPLHPSLSADHDSKGSIASIISDETHQRNTHGGHGHGDGNSNSNGNSTRVSDGGMRAQPPSSALSSSRRTTTHYLIALRFKPSVITTPQGDSHPILVPSHEPIVIYGHRRPSAYSSHVGAPLLARYSPDARFIFIMAQTMYKHLQSIASVSSSSSLSSSATSSTSITSTVGDGDGKAMDEADDNDNDDALDTSPIATDDSSSPHTESSSSSTHHLPFTADHKVDFRTDLISYGIEADEEDEEDAGSSDRTHIMMFDASHGTLLDTRTLGYQTYICDTDNTHCIQICTKRSEDLLVYNLVADLNPIPDTTSAPPISSSSSSSSSSPSSMVSPLSSASMGVARIGMVHESSLNALGYVQGGKKQKKWMSVSCSNGHAVIIDYARYCYIYVKPVRGLPSSPQYVIQLPLSADNIGSGPSPSSSLTGINSDTAYGVRWMTRVADDTHTHYDVLCILTGDAIIEIPLMVPTASSITGPVA